jgi:hypothetical protein
MSHDSIVPFTQDATFTFEVHPGQALRLSVSNNDGEIDVCTAPGSTVSIAATPKNGKGEHDVDPKEDFVVDHNGNHISVRPNWQVGRTASDIAHKVKTQLKEGFRAEDWDFKKMRFSGDASYDLQVTVPATLADGSTFSFRTSSGDVKVAGIDASVSVATASGDAHIERVNGKVSAHSASGDMSLRQLNGSVESNTASGDISLSGGDVWTALRSVSGDISINDVTMKNARVTTVSGTVKVDATFNNAAEYTFDSVSGDIRLTTVLPASGAILSFRSMSGDAHTAGEWARGDSKRTWKIGEATDGLKIAVKTVSGDLDANGTVSGDVDARQESMPQHVKEESSEDGEAGEAQEAGAKAEGGGPEITIDADWDKAKGWLKDIAHRVSKFVEEIDTAGDDRYKARTGENGAKTEPITVEPMEPDKPMAQAFTATEPLEPETPVTPEPPAPPAAPTEPITPPEPAKETTAQRRLRLLEAVQRGELTVDEALAQLDGDGSDES